MECVMNDRMTANEPCYCVQGNCIDRADTAGCNGKGVTGGVSYTLNTIDRHAVCFRKASKPCADGKGERWEENDTVNTLNGYEFHSDVRTPEAVCYIIDALSSNSMKSANPHSGIHETEVSKCLDTSCLNPSCNQGGVIVCYAPNGNHCGAFLPAGVSATLNTRYHYGSGGDAALVLETRHEGT